MQCSIDLGKIGFKSLQHDEIIDNLIGNGTVGRGLHRIRRKLRFHRTSLPVTWLIARPIAGLVTGLVSGLVTWLTSVLLFTLLELHEGDRIFEQCRKDRELFVDRFSSQETLGIPRTESHACRHFVGELLSGLVVGQPKLFARGYHRDEALQASAHERATRVSQHRSCSSWESLHARCRIRIIWKPRFNPQTLNATNQHCDPSIIKLLSALHRSDTAHVGAMVATPHFVTAFDEHDPELTGTRQHLSDHHLITRFEDLQGQQLSGEQHGTEWKHRDSITRSFGQLVRAQY